MNLGDLQEIEAISGSYSYVDGIKPVSTNELSANVEATNECELDKNTTSN